mgnify:CR=1 FL=1
MTRRHTAPLWRLTRCWQEDYWDFNLGTSCTNYGGCKFVDRCTSKDPNSFNSSYVVKRWNPLNRNPISVPLAGRPLAEIVAGGVPLSPSSAAARTFAQPSTSP